MCNGKKTPKFVFGVIIGIYVVHFLWQGLELDLYGEVQHRSVDDIIALVWIFSVFASYFVGRRHQREEQEGAKTKNNSENNSISME